MYLIWRMNTTANGPKKNTSPNIIHLQYVIRAEDRGKPLVIGGDGRADSPGHCAKYGSYSTIDLEEGTVNDIQLVQVMNYF